jgi:hypothetical protein
MSSRPLSTDLKKGMRSPVVMDSNIPVEGQAEYIDLIINGIEKFQNFENSSKFILENLNKNFNQNWNVIIGRDFSFDLTALTGNFLFCYYNDQIGVLIFKC